MVSSVVELHTKITSSFLFCSLDESRLKQQQLVSNNLFLMFNTQHNREQFLHPASFLAFRITTEEKHNKTHSFFLLINLSSFSSFPTRISPLGTSVLREFFSNLTEDLIFFKMAKKRSNYESSVYLRKCGGLKKFFFYVFDYL